jgi:hypothetical protein
MDDHISQIPIIHHGALNERSGETVADQVIEQREGEVRMDAYVRAQMSAPEVVKRITDLENCIWRLCQELVRLEPHNPVVEEGTLLLKNILEVDEKAHTFRSQLGAEK